MCERPLPRPALSELLLLVTFLLFGVAPPAAAQPAAQPTPEATLVTWREHLHLDLMDRRRGAGGLFFDRGLFRRLTPGMDHEYLLDVLTYDFSPAEEARWPAQQSGYRSYMGSIDKSRFATRHHVRHRAPLKAGFSFLFDGHFQEDLRAQRFIMAPGLTYSWNQHHQIGLQQTFGRYKPDLDLALSYTFDDPNFGYLDASATVLDIANNFIFEGIGVDPVLEDTTRRYERRPWLFSLYARSRAWHGLRAELTAGVQPLTKARVASQNEPARRFRWKERAYYLGSLLEYNVPLPLIWTTTIGVQYRRTSSRLARTVPAGSAYTSDYRSQQLYRAASAYLVARWQQLHVASRLTYGRYRDRQRGSDFDQSSVPQAFDYRERFTQIRLRVRRIPHRSGWVAGLTYLGMDRRYNEGYDVLREHFLTFRQTSWNARLVATLGYQVRPRTRLVLGGAYDVDGDRFHRDRGPVRYDGGFARLSVAW